MSNDAVGAASPDRTAAWRLPPAASLWLLGLILLSFLAASSVPSPLYSIYRDSWGFSALTLTLIFGSYALALLAALLVLGTLSDHRGRREVVLVSLVLELVAVALFREASSIAWLLAARTLQGIATGMLTSTLGAALIDLNRHWGTLINSVAPMVGLGIGALGAGVLVQFAPAPTRLVFDLLLVVFAVQAAAAFYLRETAPRRPGAWRALLSGIAIPAGARGTLLRLLPINTAQWALGGFFLSLGPTLTTLVSGRSSPVLGGAIIAALAFSSAITIAVVVKHEPQKMLVRGAVALIAGSMLVLAGVQMRWTGSFVLGTVIAGAGFGAAFSGSLRCLVPLVQAHERAALMAVFLASSYLAFSLPAILAGLLVGLHGLQTTAMGYMLFVSALAALALLQMVVPWARHDASSHPAP